ncbi:MAG: M1 family metallopeptidase [Bacteroidetes bacterium]|nr:M1 family metallopeptidase [Bacteroidota bacterium]
MAFTVLMVPVLSAQNIYNNPNSNHGNKFEQLGTILPDANTVRTGSGAPGHEYWQQRADYVINARLDENDNRLHGDELVTYHNNSPDVLRYLWLQLDENEHQPNAEYGNIDGSAVSQPATTGELEALERPKQLQGLGVNILSVTDKSGKPIKYTINNTMMRIDLPMPLKSGQKYEFRIKWNYKIPARLKVGGRGGYEYFPGDGNTVYTIAQWYPRMCVYNEHQGWNNKQFTGRGEFTLVFGNYEVNMTVPADHVVAATGVCQNPSEVLTGAQLSRWRLAQKATSPIEVVTLEEAKAREKNPDKSGTKVWRYKAENVRDFAWGSSRKFVWDAMANVIEGKSIMCMSYYPKEAYALYSRYSTKVVAHTLNVYSKHTIPYPYPVAISVEANNGMEYPMICFNYGRTDGEGTYTARTKYGMIGVVIHEVGHNFFPMIVNSDERQWSWMDEGLNTFVQFLAEQEFDNNFPSSRGPAHKIVDYMRMPPNQLEPIMTNSENIVQFGNNAYGKPATALNILRETILGRELFDYAFKEYCMRWAFKHPTPADFFRTMEDASGVDLDWFWRGWFYDIQPVDISLDSVNAFTVGYSGNVPVKWDTIFYPASRNEFVHISRQRNKASGMQFLVDKDTSLRDFYYYYVPPRDTAKRVIRNQYASLAPLDSALRDNYSGNYYYQLHFTNKGGLVMPIIIQWNYEDGTSEVEYINAYIWRKNELNFTKTFVKAKKVKSILIDPYLETADIDTGNNSWPRNNGSAEPSRYDVFRFSGMGRFENNDSNPMKEAKKK